MFGMGLQLFEANQSAGLFIPEPEIDGSHAGCKGDWFDGLKQWIGPVTLLQVVIGEFGTEEVNVVKSDVSREPLQYLWKFQVGATFKGHLFVIPILLPGPDYIFKLVLYIEQPDPGYSCEIDDWDLNHQKCLPAHQKNHSSCKGSNNQVGNIDTLLLRWQHGLIWKTKPDHKQNKRSYKKYGYGIPVNPIFELLSPGKGLVLFNGECLHIAVSSFIQVPHRFVVNVMLLMPIVVGRECKAAQEGAYDLVGSGGTKKGAVAAIVENNKHPHLETSSEKGQGQGQEVGDPEAVIHSCPEQEIGDQRVDNLPDAFPNIRFIEVTYNLNPIQIIHLHIFHIHLAINSS